MFFGNASNKAKMLHEVQGVKILYTREFENAVDGSICDEELNVVPLRGSQSECQKVHDVHQRHVFHVRREQQSLKTLWDSRPSWLRVVYCNSAGDRSLLETCVNVATSIPFVVIGLQVPRETFARKVYANSIIGVGVASCLYHTSRGEARKLFRFGDYAMIAASALCLSSVIRNDNSRALTLASALMIPLQPTLVTMVHTGIMEATFARRAASDPKLKRAHSLHTASTIIGGALFVADDMLPRTPYIHAAWHLAAAFGIATCNKLLD